MTKATLKHAMCTSFTKIKSFLIGKKKRDKKFPFYQYVLEKNH